MSRLDLAMETSERETCHDHDQYYWTDDGCPVCNIAVRLAEVEAQRNFAQRQVVAADARAERLEAALREIDALDPEHLIDGYSQTAMRGLVLRMGEIARAALQQEGGEPCADGNVDETCAAEAADRIEADARRIAKLEEALAALVLNIDAGGATLGAMRDARALLAPTGGGDGSA